MSPTHAPEGERKQVTVLFADVKSSMELLTDRDPEEAQRVLDPILERMKDAVHRYGGTVNQVMGDGIMALFGAPVAHEDDALRACCAALRMQENMARWNEELSAGEMPVQIRIGVNSGEAVVRYIRNDLHLDYTAVGQTTFLAARMEQVAPPGAILLTGEVVRLAGAGIDTKPLGSMAIKGLKETREVFQLRGITPGTRFAVHAARGLTRFVGRTAELEALAHALRLAERGDGQIVALVGEAGVGKSRVVWELIHSELARSWRVLMAAAASYATDTVHFLFVQLLHDYFGIDGGEDVRTTQERVAARMRALHPELEASVEPILALLEALPAESAFRRVEASERRRRTLVAVRSLLVHASHAHPLILVLEDLHWIDSGSRVLLDSVIAGLPAARLLITATFRPEYEHDWSNTTRDRQLRIDPLAPELARELLDSLLGQDPELMPLKALLAERCAGNSFFLEESVRTLVEEGTLRGIPGVYELTRPVRTVRMPASVQAVLTARIDRLPPDDKDVLQSAAVIGREVPFTLLQAISGRPDEQCRRGLARLCSSEFVYELESFPEPLYAFRHALTHEAAYNGMLRERRRRLHARIVEAIEHRYPDRLSDQVERLAHHAQRGEVWDKAVHYLRMAGSQAYTRGALDEAIERYETALAIVARLPADAETVPKSIDLRLDLHAPLMTVGRTHRIVELYPEAERLARQLDDPLRLGQVLQRSSQIAWLRGQYRSGADYARQALDVAQAADDAVTRLHAHYFLGLHCHALGDYRSAIPCFAFLVEGPDASLASRVISVTVPMDVPGWCWLAFASMMTGDVIRAEAAIRRAVDTAEASEFPQARVIARTIEAVVRAYIGRAATCVASLEAAVDLCEQIRFVVWLAAAYSTLGLVLTRAGRPESALPHLERAVAANEKTGVRTYRAQRYVWWAEALLRAGKLEEALARVDTAADIAGTMEERGVEAEAFLMRALITQALGRHGDARSWFERSLAASAALGTPLIEAHTRLGLASLLEQAGDKKAARHHREAAHGIFRTTGAAAWWPVS